MDIENSDQQIEEFAGDVRDERVEEDNEMEVDAGSLAAAAQGAGISDRQSEEESGEEDSSEEVEASEPQREDTEVATEEGIDSEDGGQIEDAEDADAEVQVEPVKEISGKDEDAEDGGGNSAAEDGQEKSEQKQQSENKDDEQEAEGENKEAEPVTSVHNDSGVEVTVESVVEAILFASDEPITANRLVNIVETGSVKQVRECVKSLNEKYQANNSSFRIERIAGGYQMMTLDAYNHWLRKMIRVRSDNKLTQAALETLAIIAYKQPIIRADVEGIRGVSSGEMIRSLMYKGLVRITGREEVLGRPMLYGTTKKFLDVFGLNSTKDLPKLEDLKRPETIEE